MKYTVDDITIGDFNKMVFAFRQRIEELKRLREQNGDMSLDISKHIQEYEVALEKYRSLTE